MIDRSISIENVKQLSKEYTDKIIVTKTIDQTKIDAKDAIDHVAGDEKEQSQKVKEAVKKAKEEMN